MVTGYKNGTIVRTGLSLVAVLMLSGAAFAGPATATADNAVVPEPGFGGDLIAVQATDEVTTGGEGIAVGEPDPTTGDGTGGDPTIGGDPVVDDGTGGDPVVDDGTGGDGTAGDPSVGDGTGGDPTVGDGTGGEVWITDGGVPVDGGTIDFGDGTVGIYYMDGGPSRCGGCEYQNTAGPLIEPSMTFRGNQPAAHQPQIVTGSDRDVARQPVARGAAACLVQHPGLAWMCEWQSGASQ